MFRFIGGASIGSFRVSVRDGGDFLFHNRSTPVTSMYMFDLDDPVCIESIDHNSYIFAFSFIRYNLDCIEYVEEFASYQAISNGIALRFYTSFVFVNYVCDGRLSKFALNSGSNLMFVRIDDKSYALGVDTDRYVAIKCEKGFITIDSSKVDAIIDIDLSYLAGLDIFGIKELDDGRIDICLYCGYFKSRCNIVFDKDFAYTVDAVTNEKLLIQYKNLSEVLLEEL